MASCCYQPIWCFFLLLFSSRLYLFWGDLWRHIWLQIKMLNLKGSWMKRLPPHATLVAFFWVRKNISNCLHHINSDLLYIMYHLLVSPYCGLSAACLTKAKTVFLFDVLSYGSFIWSVFYCLHSSMPLLFSFCFYLLFSLVEKNVYSSVIFLSCFYSLPVNLISSWKKNSWI